MGTFVTRKVEVVSDRKEVIGDFTFSNSYTTGGEAISGSTFGLDIQLDYVQVNPATKSDDSRVIVTALNAAGTKIMAYGLAAGATGLTEIANTGDLSTFTARVRAVGKGSASFYPTT